ncbi:target of EGR1 protein 1-like [Haliotis rufescens]|uniref:target of EGR1 protein 1-like n=1 Tax=Haliotis rufescens TaxID=6454 RepID=UPI00201EE95A|nr:target of EGR1 protein 1-like [Haliotis rufescens]
MSSSSIFSRVPVIDVHQENFQEVWPSLVLAIKSATFIGMDLELSGLGNRKALNFRAMDDRYRAMADVARSRSVLSLGLSCFKCTDIRTAEVKVKDTEPTSPSKAKNDWKYLVQTFNILVLCEEDFIVEPITLKFLVDHGFDFNKQYSKGISYYRGNDKTTDSDSKSLRQLINILVLNKAPVVFHNALMDLVFLYQSFYASLPSSVAAFVTDLTEVFEGGVFDTKYITEYMERLPASYLEYAFRRCQRKNSFSLPHEKDVVSLEFLDYPTSYTYVRYSRCELPHTMVERGDDADSDYLQRTLCHQYASFGWCSRGSSCPKSHDIDDIIDLDGIKPARKSRKRKRRRNNQLNSSSNEEEKAEETDESTEDSCSKDEEMESDSTVTKKMRVISPVSESYETQNKVKSLPAKTGSESESGLNNLSNKSDLGIARKEGHRAGYDAFMTGYIMAYYFTKYGKLPAEKRRNVKLTDLNVEEFKNKVYLCGKDIPLVITKSSFTKSSKDHREKMQKIKS